jgi:hypothetical protein
MRDIRGIVDEDQRPQSLLVVLRILPVKAAASSLTLNPPMADIGA